MAKKKVELQPPKTAKEFGKKEKVLNYTCQTYQLSRPNKVGQVMALIRQCQPSTLVEWEQWYFDNAVTQGKAERITKEKLTELGERLYSKVTTVVIPEWQEAFSQITLDDCIDYIYNLTINRTYDGYIREKHVVYGTLAELFPEITFEASEPELDHASDIDFVGWNERKTAAIGLQIKPVTAQSNFGNYSPSERMKHNFDEFERRFHGKVFIIYSEKEKINNSTVIEEMKAEVARITKL
jgi:hypothetical protein